MNAIKLQIFPMLLSINFRIKIILREIATDLGNAF